MTTGERLKSEGIDLALHNRKNVEWIYRAICRLRYLARSGDTFTSEDVTVAVGQPSSSGAVGALMNTAARQGWIVRVGFEKAVRDNQHAALITQWHGVIGKIPEPCEDASGAAIAEQLGFF